MQRLKLNKGLAAYFLGGFRTARDILTEIAEVDDGLQLTAVLWLSATLQHLGEEEQVAQLQQYFSPEMVIEVERLVELVSE